MKLKFFHFRHLVSLGGNVIQRKKCEQGFVGFGTFFMKNKKCVTKKWLRVSGSKLINTNFKHGRIWCVGTNEKWTFNQKWYIKTVVTKYLSFDQLAIFWENFVTQNIAKIQKIKSQKCHLGYLIGHDNLSCFLVLRI